MLKIYEIYIELIHGDCWGRLTSDGQISAFISYARPKHEGGLTLEVADLVWRRGAVIGELLRDMLRYNIKKIITFKKTKVYEGNLAFYIDYNTSARRVLYEEGSIWEKVLVENGREKWKAIFIADDFTNDLNNHLVRKFSINGIRVLTVKAKRMGRGYVFNVRIDKQDTLTDLTINERRILSFAYKMGFFDYPRRISLDEIADEFGISKTMVNKYIRNSINKILRGSMSS
jgi:Predicted DNA binding protein